MSAALTIASEAKTNNTAFLCRPAFHEDKTTTATINLAGRGGNLTISHPLRVVGIQDGQPCSVDDCDVVFGGTRHLALVKTTARKITWAHPFADNRSAIRRELEARQKVAIIATGDPLSFGVGDTLIAWFGEEMVQVEPSLSSYALACARMAWQQQNVRLVTAHGRPITDLHPSLHHQARLVVLGDGGTAVALSQMLRDIGLGSSKITALSHLGGPEEQIAPHPLSSDREYPALTCYAVECFSDRSQASLALGPGLPDQLFDHDGTITKRDIRAITLAKLAPRDGQIFWDIGTGNGSIAIEWARLAPNSRVFAIDTRPERLAKAQANAIRLAGPARINFIAGNAPEDLPKNWPTPDAVFVGGGLAKQILLTTLWEQLNSGGRLVANAVTLEGEASLLAFRQQHGGELTRISVAKEEAVGALLGWKPSMPILQYEGHKLT